MAELDIAGILRKLTDGGVDFFLIGGVAVGYHGHVRATKDVDVVPSPDQANLERLATVLAQLDARVDGAEEFDPAELPDPLDPKALATGDCRDAHQGRRLRQPGATEEARRTTGGSCRPEAPRRGTGRVVLSISAV